ncbi:MAG: type II toxin-antitoxin system VapC family toxin [Anaerolineae bacterium]
MRYFLDTSAVVKRYAPERGSRWIKSLIENPKISVTIVQICIVEVAAALARKVRTGEISRNSCQKALTRFLADMDTGDYEIAKLDDEVVSFAVGLTQRHPLRGYDAVHLAAALVLNRALLEVGLSPLIFVAADNMLCKAAEKEKLAVDNPNQH